MTLADLLELVAEVKAAVIVPAYTRGGAIAEIYSRARAAGYDPKWGEIQVQLLPASPD